MKEKINKLAKKLDLDNIVNENARGEDDSDDFKMSSKGFVKAENKESKTLNVPKKRIPTEKQLENLKNAREKAHEVVRAKGTITRAKKEEEIRKRDELLEKAKQLKSKQPTPSSPPVIPVPKDEGEIEYIKKIKAKVSKPPPKKVVYVSESESSEESEEEEEVVVVKKKPKAVPVPKTVSLRPPSPPPMSEKQYRINSFLSQYYNI